MAAISGIQRVQFYIYKKQKLRKVLIYQKSRYFAKSKTICVAFLYTKIETPYVTRFFIKKLKIAEGGAFLYSQNNALFRCIFICKI